MTQTPATANDSPPARGGAGARNERGQLSVAEFKSIGTKVWP